jgi:hypothetical protein
MVERLLELARVLLVLPHIELARKRLGPAPLVSQLRLHGARQRSRSEANRSRLRAAIASVDGRFPDGGNCYRRVLLEIALDPDAAKQPFFMGLVTRCEPSSGHAWVGAAADSDRSYDAIISL